MTFSGYIPFEGNTNLRLNKQLFLSEIVFRFRKDIGSPRRPGFVIYSP